MTKPQRILFLSGVFLIAMTMVYGVWYAIFDEHQTLLGMGIQMATGFTAAADGDLEAAAAAFANYAAIRTEYGHEIHAHGHWGMLALILIILGLIYARLSLPPTRGILLARLLALSALLFPLGVLLQSSAWAGVGQVLSLLGSLGMVLGMLVAAWALRRVGRP